MIAVDVAAVLLAVDVADAGRLAALDVVVEAGHARAPARLGPLAGPVLEQLAEQVERLAHPLGRGEGPEVGAVRAVALAGEVDARELLVEADRDVGIGLVVAQPDVEPRPVALDEALLGEQRLGLGLGDQRLDRVDLVEHAGGPAQARAEPAALAREVRGDALADRVRLAHVERRRPRGRGRRRRPGRRAGPGAARSSLGSLSSASSAIVAKGRLRRRPSEQPMTDDKPQSSTARAEDPRDQRRRRGRHADAEPARRDERDEPGDDLRAHRRRRLARRPGAVPGADRDRRGPRLLAPAATSTGSRRASRTPSTTCPRTCAAAPRCCTRRSSTSAASPIP